MGDSETRCKSPSQFLRLLLAAQRGQLSEARNLQVRMTLRSLHCPNPASTRRAIHPYRGKPQRLRWNYIVVNTLSHVQDAMCGNPNPAQRELKYSQRRFISARLLRRNYVIKFHPKLWPGRSEKIVIHI